MQNISTYTFQRSCRCPFGFLDAITMGLLDLIVVCVADIEVKRADKREE